MSEVEEYIYQFEGEQRKLLFYLYKILSDRLDLTDKIRFKIPFYYGRSWICYLNPKKTGKVEVCFIRGNELSNSQGLLDSKGRKQVCSLEFEKVADIPHSAVNEIIQEAILLDEMAKTKTKRKTK